MLPIEVLLYIGIFLGLYFAVFIFLTFFEHRKVIYQTPKKQDFPSVCLIVPCYNEENNVERAVKSLVDLDYPKEKLEVIVVDDGSQDNTFLKATAFAEKNKRVRVFRKENGGKYTALNYAIEKTSSEFVGSVDADSYVDASALKKLMRYFDDPKVTAVTSTVKIAEPKTILEGVQFVEYLIAAFLRKVFSFIDSISVTPGPLSIFRKEVFKVLGPYREAHQTEDLEMAFRLQKANCKITHAIDAVVYTKGCETLKELFRQRLRWRRGFLLNLKDYPCLLNIKRHGNLSFLLYYSIVGSIIGIALVMYALWRLSTFFFEKASNLALVGFELPHLSSLKPDWFLLNIQPTLILGTLAIVTFLAYLFMGKKLTFDTRPLKKKTIVYLITYSFLNTFWWLSAVFAIVFKKKVTWK